VARALGRPVILNYRSGEAPDHLQRSAIARRTIARVNRNIVPSSFLVEVFRAYGIRASIIPNVVDLDRFRYRRRVPVRPVPLSTAAGGVPAILSDGENGLLAPLDDHVALAAGVLRLLADADLADRLARAAYACCRACTWASVREQWLAAYRGVLADSDSAADIAAVAPDRAVSEPTHNGSAAAPWP